MDKMFIISFDARDNIYNNTHNIKIRDVTSTLSVKADWRDHIWMWPIQVAEDSLFILLIKEEKPNWARMSMILSTFGPKAIKFRLKSLI